MRLQKNPRILRDTAYAEYILAYYKRRHQSISTTNRYDSEIRRRFAYAYASIGGLTVYCFGDPAKMSDENVRLALRVHDECNGSDVFGSDICTCRPYLTFGIEEAVKEAQQGGSGVVIYFRKEGRALGEVTKYLVYNARKRGEDRASEYFKRTENIAGVKDMRFQALMPDVSCCIILRGAE